MKTCETDHPAGCDGNGWISLDVDGVPRAKRCPTCTRDAAVRQLDRLIPPRYRAEVPLPPRIAEWTVTTDGGSLLIHGPVGTGKTTLAYNALRGWAMARTSGLNITALTAPALLTSLRTGASEMREIIDTCKFAGLLLIDDLGAEKPSEWTRERLYEIIDERYAWQRPMIITSNVPAADLRESVGDRVASRLAECCVRVRTGGGDRRRK